MIRVLNNHQDSINAMFTNGVFIYRKATGSNHLTHYLCYPLDASDTTNSIHILSQHIKTILNMHTEHVATKYCNNPHQPWTRNTCESKRPTFSYKCKSRGKPYPENPGLAALIRIVSSQTTPDSIHHLNVTINYHIPIPNIRYRCVTKHVPLSTSWSLQSSTIHSPYSTQRQSPSHIFCPYVFYTLIQLKQQYNFLLTNLIIYHSSHQNSSS